MEREKGDEAFKVEGLKGDEAFKMKGEKGDEAFKRMPLKWFRTEYARTSRQLWQDMYAAVRDEYA